jgi:hypothetical protein
MARGNDKSTGKLLLRSSRVDKVAIAVNHWTLHLRWRIAQLF